jgi:tetratricopeptide (TPR) repeat protein
MTTFQSWDDVGRWYASLERDRIVPDERVRAKVDELVRGLAGDKEKIEALYRFVARNFRYVSLSLGQGRYQPHAAPDVLSNQYGDCKDKHTLLAAMLTAAGLRAYPVLMNSSRKVDPDMPSPAQFDHVISAIPFGNETLWADTTSEVAPFRLLSPVLRDKQALLIPTSGNAHLETTPAEPPFRSSEVLEMEGKVDDFGKLSARSHLTLRGDSEMFFRVMFRRTPRSDWKQLGSYLSMINGTRGEVSELRPTEPTATEEPFELEYELSSNDFLDWSSKKLKLSLPLPSVNLLNAGVDKQAESKPLQLGPPIDITYRLKLSFPAKYQIRVPLPLKVSRDYADYVSTYRIEGNTLIAERTLHLRQRELPAERIQDYLAFVAAARSDEAQTLSLETDLAGAPAIPESAKVEELIQAAESAAKNHNYPVVEELLKRAIEKEPKHKTARRQLGWALFVQRKYEAAAEALREQTKINPFDDYSYNLLGQVFWRQQKYADAETSFRKQIDITPLDKWAHGNLGQMLVDWRKYEDAVPELEKGISLNPEETSLYLALGRAYLNLGKIEKATEAFDQAVKINAGPEVWNDVAYFFSLSKVQLVKAQQFAESAVTALATELRNVELETLELEHMEDVARLAAYWDTLGWVHFQKNDLDLAQRYISAAWMLGQHSEVGYHMGQIEEKRGRREEAIRLYSLAAVAFDPVPEARQSLDRLLGKEWNEALFRKSEAELREIRTVKLGPVGKNLKNTTEAQFYVVLIPGPSRTAQVSEVKFIKGDDKLRPLGAALKTANYNFTFPDEAATKVIRRGTLFCKTSAGECSFMMISPEFVSAID